MTLERPELRTKLSKLQRVFYNLSKMSREDERERPSFVRSYKIVSEWATGIKIEPGESLWSYSQKLPDARWGRVLCVALLSFSVYGSIVYYTLPYTLPFFHWISAHVSKIWKPENSIMIGATGVLVTLISGQLLVLFKRKNQIVYGLVEIIISCTICFYTFQIATETQTLLAVAARIIPAVYFTTRGLTNFWDGVKAEEAKNAQLQGNK
jgi:hypothetical protein